MTEDEMLATIEAWREPHIKMQNALLEVEWSAAITWSDDSVADGCPACGREKGHRSGHMADCRIDAALTASGLPTAESRDAARALEGL